MNGSVQYNLDLYDENSIIHLVAHYQNLLGEIMAKTSQPMAELEMLTPSERQRIVFDWNELQADFPQVCIQDLISEQVEKDPEAPAVECNGVRLTYGDVEKKPTAWHIISGLKEWVRDPGLASICHDPKTSLWRCWLCLRREPLMCPWT